MTGIFVKAESDGVIKVVIFGRKVINVTIKMNKSGYNVFMLVNRRE